MRPAQRILVACLLATLAIHQVRPIAAFEWAGTGARSVSASVVSDASAYVSFVDFDCAPGTAGAVCASTLVNRGTHAIQFTITKSQDANSMTTSYSFSGVTPVTSGPTSTAGTVAAGGSVTFEATIRACLGCAGSTRYVYWAVEASHADMDFDRTRLEMPLIYS